MTSEKQLTHSEKEDEENIAAQRSAAEAIAISRATLEMTLAQSEQLEHCERLQDRNQYIIEKSNRMVRGLTWSGWMMNAFSKDVGPPMDQKASDGMKKRHQGVLDGEGGADGVSRVLGENDYGDLPEPLVDPVRKVQNYECNVILLERCQTRQDFETLLEICKSLHTSAQKSLLDTANLRQEKMGTHSGLNDGRSFQLLKKVQVRFEQVEDLQFRTVQNLSEKFDGVTHTGTTPRKQGQSKPQSPPRNGKKSLGNTGTSSPVPFQGTPSKDTIWAKTNDTILQQRIKKQDEHLNTLAGNIQELLHNGASIGTTLEQQNRLLEKLDAGTDDLAEQTKMVTRRANRLSHRSLFRSPKSEWKYNVSIQHISSKKYLRIEPTKKNKVALHTDLHPDLSVFEVHERRNSDLVGFMNKCTRTWLGQSTLGYIVCNAKKFGRNEEWDIDESNDIGMGRSKLLCACANWGNGGWLKVDEQNESFAIGNYDSQEKKSASTWSIVIHDTGSHE